MVERTDVTWKNDILPGDALKSITPTTLSISGREISHQLHEGPSEIQMAQAGEIGGMDFKLETIYYYSAQIMLVDA